MQRGAVLAAELRNNGFKLAKWTTCAILAGSDQMKFGYVSRQNFKDASRHTILGIQNFKPQEFATQMALNIDNGWGIVRGRFSADQPVENDRNSRSSIGGFFYE